MPGNLRHQEVNAGPSISVQGKYEVYGNVNSFLAGISVNQFPNFNSNINPFAGN